MTPPAIKVPLTKMKARDLLKDELMANEEYTTRAKFFHDVSRIVGGKALGMTDKQTQEIAEAFESMARDERTHANNLIKTFGLDEIKLKPKAYEYTTKAYRALIKDEKMAHKEYGQIGKAYSLKTPKIGVMFETMSGQEAGHAKLLEKLFFMKS